MNIKFITIIFIFSYLLCYAQSDTLQLETEQTIEDLLEEPGEESDNSDLYELIEYYVDHPVNINTASLTELSDLPYVDISIAKLIIDHRNKYGAFFSPNELYSISAIPQDVVKKFLPFISVTKIAQTNYVPDRNFFSDFSVKMRNRALNDLQQRRGFKENKFIGSPYKIYNRVNASYNNINIGFLTDKDAGENSLNDFSSGYINVSNWMNFNNIIVGDYLVKFGQGLALWSPYGFSKGTDAVYSVKKVAGNIKSYSSATENNFFRGAAAEYKWEQVILTGFYSRNSLDANLDSESGLITSTPLDGFHRTSNELIKRKSIYETSYGISLKYSLSNPLSLGFLYYNSEFNHSFLPSDIYDIKGDKFNYYSSCYDLFISNFNLFGETAFNGTSVASFNGLKFSASPEFVYTLSIRNYPRNYINLHGFGFGERSGASQNEFGIYNGFRWRTSAGVVNFYFDQFKFPYATYDNPLPSKGNEYMLHFSTKPIKGLETVLRFKLENKEVTEEVDLQNILVKRLKHSYRVDLIYNLTKQVRLKTRMEYSKFFIRDAGLSEEGYLLFEDLRVQLLNELLIYGRTIFFKTNSFNSAIYEYENDLTGILSNVGLYGEGVRFYFVLRYKIISKVSVSFKYSETFKPKEKSLGTGYSEINGNIDNRIGLQLDFNL